MSFDRFETASEEETLALGRHLATVLPISAVVSLVGNLGAGKTTLTKGIVAGLDAAMPADVTSPTYTLIHEYGSPVRVYHVDLYRLETLGEVSGLGLEEMYDKRALVLIEWADRFPQILPTDHIRIRLTYDGEDRRVVELQWPDPTVPLQ